MPRKRSPPSRENCDYLMMAGREKWLRGLRGLRGMLVEARWLDSMITMRNRRKNRLVSEKCRSIAGCCRTAHDQIGTNANRRRRVIGKITIEPVEN